MSAAKDYGFGVVLGTFKYKGPSLCQDEARRPQVSAQKTGANLGHQELGTLMVFYY